MVVVDAETPEQATQALDYLGAQFKNEQQQIKSVYIPGEGDFFDRHGLFYLDLDDLNELTGKLAEAQPFIGTLSGDNSLKSLLSIVSLAITTDDRELPVDLNPLLNNIRAVIEALLNGKNLQLSWQQLMLGEDRDLLAKQRFILLKPERVAWMKLAESKASWQIIPYSAILHTGYAINKIFNLRLIKRPTQLPPTLRIIQNRNAYRVLLLPLFLLGNIHIVNTTRHKGINNNLRLFAEMAAGGAEQY